MGNSEESLGNREEYEVGWVPGWVPWWVPPQVPHVRPNVTAPLYSSPSHCLRTCCSPLLTAVQQRFKGIFLRLGTGIFLRLVLVQRCTQALYRGVPQRLVYLRDVPQRLVYLRGLPQGCTCRRCTCRRCTLETGPVEVGTLETGPVGVGTLGSVPVGVPQGLYLLFQEYYTFGSFRNITLSQFQELLETLHFSSFRNPCLRSSFWDSL